MKHTLRNKLLSWFLLIALVPLVLLFSLNYIAFNDVLRDSINNNLTSIADSKASLLGQYINGLQNNISLLSKNPIVGSALSQSDFSKPELKVFLKNFEESYLLDDVVLISNNGKTINSNLDQKTITYQSPGIININDQAVTLLELSTSNFIEQEDNNFAFYIAAPVFKGEQLLGSVAVKANSKTLAPVVNDFAGLGSSGEVVVVSIVGEKVMSITPTRLLKNKSRAYEIDKDQVLNDKNLMPVVQAIEGKQGFGVMVDYRNVPVFAAWRYLPTLNGGMIVKIDRSEVFRPLLLQRERALVGGLVTLIIVILLAFSVAHSITSPLSTLIRIAQQMSQGVLGLRIKLETQDEIGQLGHTFNLMSDRLEGAFEDLQEMFNERTADLSLAYEEIELLNKKLKQENRRLSTELDVVRRLQEMILPNEAELREVHKLDLAAYMSPADEVGGDYYDVLSFEDRCLITIGDVTGHGLESGVFMLMAQTAIRTLYVSKEINHDRFLCILNQTLYDNAQRMNSDRSMTLSLLEYEQGGLLRFSGQHEEIIMVRRNGHLERIDTMDFGFPLGLEQNIEGFIGQGSVLLAQGDVVVLYTDGITEAENKLKHLYGSDRLCDVIRSHVHKSAREIRDAIVKDVLAFVKDHRIFDDMTLLVLKQE